MLAILLAEQNTDAIWAVLIVNSFGFLAFCLKTWRDEVNAARAEQRLNEARLQREESTKKTLAAVAEIHEATNGMKDALVKAASESGFAKGVKSETDKPHN